MQTQIIKLGFLLSGVNELPGNHGIFSSPGGEISLEANVMIADFDSLGEDEDEPAEARELGLKYLVTMRELQDIMENARLQRQNLTSDELLRALRHYVDNNSYIDFG